jgi:5-carboxymethyl-2-hydroxymuconic-semialdehyde dehydrogenase
MTSLTKEHPMAATATARLGKMLIDGKWCEATGGQTLGVINPATEEVVADVAYGTRADAKRAVEAAAKAMPGWMKQTAYDRAKVLKKTAELMRERTDNIAKTLTMEQGKPLAEAKAELLHSADTFEWFAEEGKRAYGQVIPNSAPGKRHLTIKHPVGVVAAISPWNFPITLQARKIAPALAAGCTVVHKPAEWSPLTATLLNEIMDGVIRKQGGLAGVVNMVHGLGETAGKALTEHPLIKAVGFVGDSRTGSAIMAQGAATLKRVHFELGGKNPVIVFDDADLDRALDAVLFMIYSLNGERCTSSSRALVQRSIYDGFTAKLAERVKRIKIGHPLDPATEIGPLIHSAHVDKVLSFPEHAKKEGARIACGGGRALGGKGNYVEPTLYLDANQGMKIAQDEIFGPVLTVLPFNDEAGAVRIANDVRYGLTGYIWTRDVARAHRVARDLEAGMIWINSENVRHLPTPFGGMKASGIGRDGGDYSFDFYMETKNVAVAYGTHKVPKIGG